MSLRISKLTVQKGNTIIVKDVNIEVRKGERVAIAGESGSGKSITCMSILRLLPDSLKISGDITVDKFNVLKANKRDLRKYRWNKVSMIFQDPGAALNPLIPVGKQIEEAIRAHHREENTKEKIVELLRTVKIPEPEKRIKSYPHHLSGGMKQRIMIAMALSCNPSYIIADEPTTALDVTIQAQILKLIKDTVLNNNAGLLLITHDMGIISEIAQKVYIMYAGYIVEEAPVEDIFSSPLHPYTQGLIKCSPTIDAGRKRKLFSIPGNIPAPSERPAGCPFHPRCSHATDTCRVKLPPFYKVKKSKVRCFLYTTHHTKHTLDFNV